MKRFDSTSPSEELPPLPDTCSGHSRSALRALGKIPFHLAEERGQPGAGGGGEQPLR